MGGGSIKIEGFHSLPEPRTMVLMGRTGNGKSATGNSILGRKAFISKVSSGGITAIAELQTTALQDGQVVNVIDTPGLFDYKVGYETVSQEIMKCIGLGRDGIHAVLLVFAVTNRFTEEEEAAVRALQAFFGPKITEYMIVVFTGGDALEEDQSLGDYLNDCSPELKEVLKLCNNRRVLFDNKTKDEKKKELQLGKLLSLVDSVMEENGGQPYTDSLFAEYKEAALIQQKIEEVNDSKGQITSQELAELTEKIQKSYDDQLKKMTEMQIESKMKKTSDTLLKELERERAAREKAEKAASDARKKSEDNAKKREELERERAARVKAEKAARDARKKLEDESKKREEVERRLHDEHNARMRLAAELNSRPQFCAIM